MSTSTWLLHPDVFAELVRLPSAPATSIYEFSIPMRACFCLARGHMADTAHPEWGAPTCEELAKLDAEATREACHRMNESLALLRKYFALTPNPRSP